jgi:hypothetical protein
MAAPVVSPSLAGRMRASLLGEWRQARPAQRFAYRVGAALILVGLALDSSTSNGWNDASRAGRLTTATLLNDEEAPRWDAW